MMARWMDPETGRFISPDPVQQGINFYIYSGNNPTTMIDPSGLSYWDYYGYGWGTESGYSLREQSLGGQGFYGGDWNNNFDFSPSYSSGLVNFGSYQQNAVISDSNPNDWKGGTLDGYDSSGLLADNGYELRKLDLNGIDDLNNLFPTESRFGFAEGNSNLNGSISFDYYNWDIEKAKQNSANWDELMNSTWDGSQFVPFPELDNNGLCWVSDMLWDCLDVMGETRTVGEVRALMLGLANDAYIRNIGAGDRFGYLRVGSGIVHNQIWIALGNTTGRWAHYDDMNLEHMVDVRNTYGYVNAFGMYNMQHWVGVRDLNYGNIFTYKSGYQPQISRGIVSVDVFDPAAINPANRIQTVNLSDISTVGGSRVRAVYTPDTPLYNQ